MISAQSETTTTTLVSIEEPARPFTELIVDLFGLDTGGPTAELLDRLVEPVLQVVLIVVVAFVAIRLLRRFIRRLVGRVRSRESRGDLGGGAVVSTRKAQRTEALGAVISSTVGFLVWTIALFTILGSTFGINVGPLVAGAGILGVALGFGAQDLVKDVLSGIFMLVEDQYGVGDVVDVGAATGVVEGIGLRTTRVRDVTGTLWHVPNGEIRRVGNMSQEWSRALLDIGVGYGSDVDEAAAVIKEVADTMAGEEEYARLFLAEPEIWGVESLGADSVAIRLVIKTRPGEQWAIARELRRRIKMALEQARIEIPFPQRTVWIRQETDEAPPPRRDPSAESAATGKAGAEEGAEATADGHTRTPEPD
jgi:moderate conductance mechanosensitive channel